MEKKKEIKKRHYIPRRFIIAILIALAETLAIIALFAFLCYRQHWLYIVSILIQAGVAISIACADENPDFKVPWILVVLLLPIVGYMLFFLFSKRKVTKRYIAKINYINQSLKKDDKNEMEAVYKADRLVYSQILEIRKMATTHLYNDTKTVYFPTGEEYFKSLLNDVKEARKFIFIEYFIIESGVFWDPILEVLKQKAKSGVEVKIIWDDIGCIKTLPGNYAKKLKDFNIDATPFYKLKGQANNEFNNRSHRKMFIIDGFRGYTGGINLADEYINARERFGYWKDVGMRLEGSAVNEMTKLFLMDFYSNKKEKISNPEKYYLPSLPSSSTAFVLPFGDGPRPLYQFTIGKTVIMNMLNGAHDYVYMTSPYLIIDSELTDAIKNAALRGVDVRIITPGIPDKKTVYLMTRSSYKSLIEAGVKIYEYTPGFIHAKTYISDDSLAMVGTINLDYRSLVHHFENGVILFKDPSIMKMKEDFLTSQSKSKCMNEVKLPNSIGKRIIRTIAKIFSPLL